MEMIDNFMVRQGGHPRRTIKLRLVNPSFIFMNKPSQLFVGAAMAFAILLPIASSAQVVDTKITTKKVTVAIKKKVVPKKAVVQSKKVVITKKVTTPVKRTAISKKTTTTDTTKKDIKPAPKQNIGSDLWHGATSTNMGFGGQGRGGTSGTVSAISGTSITMTGTNGTSYTVDASQVKIMNGLSISNIQVGDKVQVVGTVSGTSIAAKSINDQSFQGRNIFMGSVTAVSGSTITISGRNKMNYTVDASQATVTKGMGTKATTVAVSGIVVGEQITAVGTLNGSTVTATTIRDMGTFQKGNWAPKN